MTQNAWNAPLLTTNGQTYIGNTGGQTAASTLTAGTNVTVTNSAGGISISTTPFSDWYKITETTGTGLSSIEWSCNLSSYQAIIVVGNNCSEAGIGTRVSTDGGSTFQTSTYHVLGWEIYGSGSTGFNSGTGANKLQCFGSTGAPIGTGANEVASFHQIIWQPSNTEFTKAVSYSTYVDDDGDNILQYYAMAHISTTAVNALGLFASSGTFGGEFVVYGIKL